MKLFCLKQQLFSKNTTYDIKPKNQWHPKFTSSIVNDCIKSNMPVSWQRNKKETIHLFHEQRISIWYIIYHITTFLSVKMLLILTFIFTMLPVNFQNIIQLMCSVFVFWKQDMVHCTHFCICLSKTDSDQLMLGNQNTT